MYNDPWGLLIAVIKEVYTLIRDGEVSWGTYFLITSDSITAIVFLYFLRGIDIGLYQRLIYDKLFLKTYYSSKNKLKGTLYCL